MDEPLIARITNIVGGPLCVSAEDGQKVHDKIAPILAQGRKVSLSFAGVETLISAFLNAAVGQLYGHMEEERIRELLSVQDMESGDVALLRRVVQNAKRYFANRQKYDAAWLEEVGNDQE
jgi:STAS-like domain of unknown function (DUF4325)